MDNTKNTNNNNKNKFKTTITSRQLQQIQDRDYIYDEFDDDVDVDDVDQDNNVVMLYLAHNYGRIYVATCSNIVQTTYVTEKRNINVIVMYFYYCFFESVDS